MKVLAFCLILVSWNLYAQDAVAPDGSKYYGQLREGIPHGQGRLVAPDGTTYVGEFIDGRFHGKGRIQTPGGESYDAQFVDGRMTARGPSHYTEGAKAGYEAALLRQRPLLDAALASLTPSAPGKVNLYLLAIAGDGEQEVFRREAEFVRAQFDRDFGTRGRSVALINSRTTLGSAPMATMASIREALQAIAARMDRDNDILFVFLTSHGSKEHEFRLHQNGTTLRGLRPADLAQMLRETGVRWKAVVVSACYAGGFLEPLKDERTLLIVAARRDRPSFGCADQNEFTWFGRAFFKDALATSGSLGEAFDKAFALIAERETQEKIAAVDRSLPQIHNPRPIDDHLRRWWSQFRP